MMQGVSAITGKQLAGLAHLGQSIRDILATPIGSRVLLRDYGSDVFRLIDAPATAGTILLIYSAAAAAIAKWEPRFQLQKIYVVSANPGRITLDLSGIYLPDGRVISLQGVEVAR